MNTQQLKELRNALSCWQGDYDRDDDKEQYDMFGAAIDAVSRLEKAEREREELKHIQELNVKIKQAMHERFTRAEAEIARRDAAASQAVAWTDDNGLHLLKETVGVMVQPTQERGGNISLFTAAPPAVLPVVTDLAVELLTAALIDGADAKTALKLAAPGMGAQPQKPVSMPESVRINNGYYFDMDDIFVALDAANVPYEVKK